MARRLFKNAVGGVLVLPDLNNLALLPGQLVDLDAYFSKEYPFHIQQAINKGILKQVFVEPKQPPRVPFSSSAQSFIRKAYFHKEVTWTQFLQMRGRDKEAYIRKTENTALLKKIAREVQLPDTLRKAAIRRLNQVEGIL